MSQLQTSLTVIGAGLPRTGTLSMKKALETIYCQPCYHMYEIILKKQYDISKWQTLLDIKQSKTTSNEILIIQNSLKEILNGYIAVTDLPACGFYRELMTMYPNAKVILTIRDRNDWLRSFRKVVLPRTNDTYKEEVDKVNRILGLNTEFDKMNMDSLKFIFQNNQIDFDDDNNLLECYDEYNKTVQEIVPSERLLVHKLGDGWKPLCQFLNVNIPIGIDYPHVNALKEVTELTELLIKYQSLDVIKTKLPVVF
ncbi:sulfotransferase oxamniquine resistance [Schistosoma japonicum]|nr:sulfotransferase oxamniquine resistance [Schistosoma japonicum]